MNERELLRKNMKALREEVSALHVLEMSARICERVIAMPEYHAAKRILCYNALQMEVQTGGLIREILRAGKELYLPVTGENHNITAVRLLDPEKVHRGAFRVMEPDGNETIDPGKLDLVLVPGLAFDRSGGRIGYGAGCFDRFLPSCRGVKAGLALEMQLINRVPMESHDVYVDLVVTEKEIYRCAKDRGERKK